MLQQQNEQAMLDWFLYSIDPRDLLHAYKASGIDNSFAEIRSEAPPVVALHIVLQAVGGHEGNKRPRERSAGLSILLSGQQLRPCARSQSTPQRSEAGV